MCGRWPKQPQTLQTTKNDHHCLHMPPPDLRWRRMIRNCIFRYQSLDISYFWVKIKDSRHFQLAIHTVFHAESESAVRIDQIFHPEEKIKKNQPMRGSISYHKNSYHMSPPYFSISRWRNQLSSTSTSDSTQNFTSVIIF